MGSVVKTYLCPTEGRAVQADGSWFVADSFGFGVEREMKESGEKMGDGRSYVTGHFALDLDGADGSAAGLVAAPRDSAEPPGEVPVIVVDNPANDEDRRDGGAGRFDPADFFLL